MKSPLVIALIASAVVVPDAMLRAELPADSQSQTAKVFHLRLTNYFKDCDRVKRKIDQAEKEGLAARREAMSKAKDALADAKRDLIRELDSALSTADPAEPGQMLPFFKKQRDLIARAGQPSEDGTLAPVIALINDVKVSTKVMAEAFDVAYRIENAEPDEQARDKNNWIGLGKVRFTGQPQDEQFDFRLSHDDKVWHETDARWRCELKPGFPATQISVAHRGQTRSAVIEEGRFVPRDSIATDIEPATTTHLPGVLRMLPMLPRKPGHIVAFTHYITYGNGPSVSARKRLGMIVCHGSDTLKVDGRAIRGTRFCVQLSSLEEIYVWVDPGKNTPAVVMIGGLRLTREDG